jgi:8-oxo-dGTP diphosphatase
VKSSGAAKDAPRRITDIDWSHWTPTERATLLFVIRDGEILLIHKKTGMGAGKINGPGGRIEAGESAMDGAVREVREELCVDPVGTRACGELFFSFTDGYMLHCSVFAADDFTGALCETDEAAPLWVPVSRIPFDRMWEDDRLWIPLMLDGRPFRGYFVFEGDAMLDSRIDEDYTLT